MVGNMSNKAKYVWAELDFSRCEPVCLAAVTGCKSWLRIFDQEIDLYQAIANMVYHLGVDMNDPTDVIKKRLKQVVTADMRDNCKVSTLAIMYDESPFAFARRSGIEEEEAKKFFKEFDKAFPEIKAYKDDKRNLVALGAMNETLWQQRRSTSFPRTGNWKEDKRRASSVERQHINLPIQALAAGIALFKASETIEWIFKEKLQFDAQVVNIVHDSQWLIIREELLPLILMNVRAIMQNMKTLPFPFEAKLLTDCKIGYDLSAMMSEDKWWAAKKLEKAGKN
jgi:DNA polymerase I-like protein with 3'-5' exonuclease and polymerase domains